MGQQPPPPQTCEGQLERKELEVSFLRIVAQHLQDLPRPHREVKVMQLGPRNEDYLTEEGEKYRRVFRANEKGSSSTVGICSRFPRHSEGGTPQKRESFSLIIWKKQPQQLDIDVCGTCNHGIFLLHEQKVRSLQDLGLNWISFKHPAIVSFCVWKNPGPCHLSGDKRRNLCGFCRHPYPQRHLHYSFFVAGPCPPERAPSSLGQTPALLLNVYTNKTLFS